MQTYEFNCYLTVGRLDIRIVDCKYDQIDFTTTLKIEINKEEITTYSFKKFVQ